MKTMRLVFHRLKHYLLQNKLIFILYLLGSVSCVVAFIFFYGNMLSVKTLQGTDSRFRTYDLSLNSPQVVTKEQEEALSGAFTGTVALKTDIAQEVGIDHGFYPVCLVATLGDRKIRAYELENMFSREEREKGALVVSIPDHSNLPVEEGKLTLFGHEFEVIESNYSLGDFYIPYQTYHALKLPSTNITLIADKRLSGEQESALLSKAHELFPDVIIEEPARDDEAAASLRMGAELMMVSAIYLAAFLCFVFLMKFMLDRNSFENVVYSLAGAKKGYVLRLVLLENAVLSLFSGLIGILLHKLLYDSFFAKANIFENITYSAGDYLLILAFTLCLSVLTMVPFSLRYSRYTLAEARSRYS